MFSIADAKMFFFHEIILFENLFFSMEGTRLLQFDDDAKKENRVVCDLNFYCCNVFFFLLLRISSCRAFRNCFVVQYDTYVVFGI